MIVPWSGMSMTIGGVTVTYTVTGTYKHGSRASVRLDRKVIRAPVRGVDLSRFPLRCELFSTWNPRVHGTGIGGWRIDVAMRVLDRQALDHDGRREEMEVVFTRDVHEVEVSARGAEAVLYEIVKEAVLHELAECWMVDGVRVRDPHRLTYTNVADSG